MEEKWITMSEWIRETRLLKFNFDKLANYISEAKTCPHYIWQQLEGNMSDDKAKILLSIWGPYKDDDLFYLIPFLKENNIV